MFIFLIIIFTDLVLYCFMWVNRNEYPSSTMEPSRANSSQKSVSRDIRYMHSNMIN